MTDPYSRIAPHVDAQRENRAVNQDRFLDALVASLGNIEEAAAQAGVSRTTVYRWTKQPDFAARFVEAKTRARRAKTLANPKTTVIIDPGRQLPPPPPLVDFRRQVFGFPSIHTHEAFARAYDDRTNLVIFWIAPAGAGKDTVGMQAAAHAVAAGEERIGVLCETERQASKRIDAYLDPYFTSPATYTRVPQIPDGVMPIVDFIDTWGPFRWDASMRLVDGTRPPRVKWDKHNKWFVGRNTPLADPNLWAVGLGSAIAGSRLGLLVCSDIFTIRNQRDPGFRRDQLEEVEGTIDSRLDEAGRLVVLNHHVAPSGHSNLAALLEAHIGNAPIVETWGDYIKYGNGVAVVVTPALTLDDEGREVSYWPQRFPVHGRLIVGDEQHSTQDMSVDQIIDLTSGGARRVRGLVDRRDRNPALFNLIYQQDPTVSTFTEFPDELLDGCDDTDRTLGVWRPGEVLTVGVDPARAGGAAWVLWATAPDTGVATVVDFYIGENLGYGGMKEMLIRDPVTRYRPRWLVWETNYESESPHDPEIVNLLRRYSTSYVPHHTHHNRLGGDLSVPSMADDMRDRLIRFPALTAVDRQRLRELKAHFRAFDPRGITARKRDPTSRHRRTPDDGCMAAWVGWKHIREWLRSRSPGRAVHSPTVSKAVADAFAGYKVG